MDNLEGVKSLGVLAARLLLVYLLDAHNPQPRTIEEELALVGTSRRQSFYEARAELLRLGYITTHRTSRGVQVSLSTSIVGWGGVVEGEGCGESSCINKYINILGGSSSGSTSGLNGTAFSDVTESVAPESVTSQSDTTESVTSLDYDVTESVVYPLRIQQKVLHQKESDVTESVVSLHDTTESVTSQNHDVTESVTSLEDRCSTVDEMDDTGPETSAKSPFGKRRAAQVVLIREMWKKIFPQDAYPLTDRNAKIFLSLCDNSAVMVYQELGDIARKKPGLDAPIGYVMKTLRGRAEQSVVRRETPKPTPTTSVVGEVGGVVWDGDYLPITETYKEKARKAKEQARKRFGEENYGSYNAI